jgi:predicted ATPase
VDVASGVQSGSCQLVDATVTTGVPVCARVPAPLTALIGRELEVAQLRTLLTDEASRLVTVTGAGGCGKTRLAIEVAPQVGVMCDDGVAFVGLAAVNDPALVAGEVARALGVATPVGVTEIDALTEALRTRRMLLVFDNFEHLMPATNMVAAVLGRCPGVSLLVTSRRRLQLPGERVMPLPPLRVPPQQGDAPHASPGPAVELFWERARAVAPHLERTPANAGAVAEIVLDSMGCHWPSSWLLPAAGC